SRGLCRLMGGDITVQSEVNKGSRFTVRLPAWSADPKAAGRLRPALPEQSNGAPEAARTGASSWHAGSPLVLLIDDDATVRDLLARFLGQAGFSIRTASSGEEGLRLAGELRPAAITLDVVMPGIDGWAVLAALKTNTTTATIPVIMVTMIDDQSKGYSLGAS